MDFSVNYGILQGVFAVPNCVVDQHIKLAGAAQLKVLLFLLRHSGEHSDCDEMATRLGYSSADIKDAVNYWAEVGVLVLAVDGGQTPAVREQPAPVKENVAAAAAQATVPDAPQTPVFSSGNIKKITTSYRFTQKEAFLRIQESEELRFVIEQCKLLMGRELQGSDVAALVSMHDWVGLPPDVILMAVEYCASRGRTDMRSIERQCTMWTDIGIRTHEQAEDYIKRQAVRHSRETLVQGAFGISGRNLSTKEHEAMARWFDEYGYDIAMIRAAYEKTVDNTGKLSFAYLDKILSNWYSKGIKTVEEAMGESTQKPKRGASTSLDISSIENEGIYDTPTI
ncbi:MAG: DnaD domain protein [Acetanaerobacterium sp.]